MSNQKGRKEIPMYANIDASELENKDAVESN